ncbi:WxL domain-containing protein [Latilactobacillus curvatus]|nr:WxL domain-containing protein [Latilactobacillus curvatus]
MKFTKLTSTVLAGATVLSILAPTASFAATSTQGSADAKTNDNGGTKLPQNDHTEVGISFGDNSSNGNTGFLRLQMVPHTLDFGNHKLIDDSKLDFTADGKNESLSTNNTKGSFDGTDANQTATLKTGTDTALDAVKGTAWATVVDKQVTRVDPMNGVPDTTDPANPKPTSGFHTGTDNKAGSWKLSVQSTNALTAVDNNDPSQPIVDEAGKTEEIAGAKLTFTDTQYAQTQNVLGLTKDKNDSTYAKDLAGLATAPTAKAVGSYSKSISTSLAANGTDITVATAAAGEGQGANVFGWMPTNIKLTMPAGAEVSNAVYKANLTWTLSSTVA